MTSPIALVTGVSRAEGIGAAVVTSLVADGWTVATVGWTAYDDRMPWGRSPDAVASSLVVEADLALPDAPALIFDQVEAGLGPVTALVMAHCESVDSDLRTTTVESFDRHMAVNARATWLLIQRFAGGFPGPPGRGRIVGLTSDHTAGNLPYGASKGAMDRIVLAAAIELADLGVTANVVNPGPTDTGWMDDGVKSFVRGRTPLGRLGQPTDAAAFVRFLCSDEGAWINGQLIKSDGGFSA